MSRFLLMGVSLAQFCLVLWPLRHHWRRCMEWFTGSLSMCTDVMKQGKMFGLLMYLEIVLMLLSLSAQSFMFFCYVPVFSTAFRQGQFVRCLSCATRHLQTWINTAQSRLEVPFSCVGRCFGCFTGEQNHADYIPDRIPSPYFTACHTIVRFRKIPAQCFFWPL